MAKYDEGDAIRLQKTVQFGSVTIRTTTKGRILDIKSPKFGRKKYKIKFEGFDEPLILEGDSHFVPQA